MLIVSKNNGRNYYGFKTTKSNPEEVVKEGGYFYLAKYIIGKGLTAIGNPIKNFRLIEN